MPPPIDRELWAIVTRADLDLLTPTDRGAHLVVIMDEDGAELATTKATGLRALEAWLEARAVFGPHSETVNKPWPEDDQ